MARAVGTLAATNEVRAAQALAEEVDRSPHIVQKVCAPQPWTQSPARGWLTNPKKAAYNRVYNRTTFSVFGILGAIVSALLSTSKPSRRRRK